MTYAHVDKRALTVVIGFRATFYKKTYIHIYIYIYLLRNLEDLL